MLSFIKSVSPQLYLNYNSNIIAKKLRINKDIRSPKVLLIDGEDKIGEITLEEALRIADSKEMDLVEVSPESKPPVCKIMDYGTHLYNIKKKAKKQKRGQKQTETKGIRLSIRIEKHDLEVKAKAARKFIEERNIVKATVLFRGREMAHGDLGKEKLLIFAKLLEEVAVVEQEPKRQGFQMSMILKPIK